MTTSGPELPSFSLSDVAKHKSDDDAWVVIEGKVYDVTKFKATHPGGEDVLFDTVGRDATREFNDVGHSKGAVKQLDSLLVGTLLADSSKGKEAEVKEEAPSFLREIGNWFESHSDQIAQVGTASAVAVLAVYIAKRYIVPNLGASPLRAAK